MTTIFKKKDDILTIDLPGSDLVFTRYLYVKEEVRIALLVSILNKSDDAIFWAYEMYYSGFKHELFTLIWKIYYDFFATINPAYEAYLIKKHREILELDLVRDINLDRDKLVSSIIQDLLFRPFNSDVFLIRNIVENFDIDIDYHNSTEKIIDISELFTQWIKNNDYRSISQWIFNVNKTIDVVEIYIFV